MASQELTLDAKTKEEISKYIELESLEITNYNLTVGNINLSPECLINQFAKMADTTIPGLKLEGKDCDVELSKLMDNGEFSLSKLLNLMIEQSADDNTSAETFTADTKNYIKLIRFSKNVENPKVKNYVSQVIIQSAVFIEKYSDRYNISDPRLDHITLSMWESVKDLEIGQMKNDRVIYLDTIVTKLSEKHDENMVYIKKISAKAGDMEDENIENMILRLEELLESAKAITLSLTGK
jgi:hypothetical protein